MELAGEERRTKAMDHHGLVAGMFQELGIAERINHRIDKGNTRRVVSAGQAVVAMIINGLGFTNRRLYLSHQFFETKPVEQLLGPGIAACDITDHTLGLALGEIATYGASRLFGEVAFGVALDHQLLSTLNHLDTTSLSVYGEYARQNQEEEVSYVEITHGYSKDQRPDLKQVVLSLVVNGPAALPLLMDPLKGNSSDKQNFPETISKVRAFQQQINLDKDFKWVGDSALYTKEGLLKQNDYLWLTRVPETIKEARLLVEKPEEAIDWKALQDGYQIARFTREYGDIVQRWLLVYSEQAYLQEKQTLEKQLEKKDQQVKNALWHLGSELFACEEDARKALVKRSASLLHCTGSGGS